MVRGGWLALAWLLLSPAAAVGALLLEAASEAVELGRPLRVTLYDTAPEPGLEGIDLAPLEALFGVVSDRGPEWVETDRWPGREVQRLRLRLYPRRLGSLEIPPLTLGDAHTAPRRVTVRPARAAGGVIEVRPPRPALRPWQRQQLILWSEVRTPERFASLRVDGRWRLPGFEVVPLPATRRQGDAGETVLGIGWALFPLVAGHHRIVPPAIAYRLSGGTRRRFHLPLVTLEVRPLPPYVPPTLPVGRVQVRSALQPAGTLRAGRLAYWRLVVSGEALAPLRLPAVGPQLRRDHPGLALLEVETTRRQTPDRQGVHGRAVYGITLKPAGTGRLGLPAIRLQYFDPGSGRLVHVVHHPPNPWVVAPWVPVTGGLLGSLAAGWLLVRGLRRGRRWWRRQAARRRALAALEGAGSPQALCAALRALGAAEGWPENLSLGAWQAAWQARHPTAPPIGGPLGRLSDACYRSGTPADLSGLRGELVAALRAGLHRRGSSAQDGSRDETHRNRAAVQ